MTRGTSTGRRLAPLATMFTGFATVAAVALLTLTSVPLAAAHRQSQRPNVPEYVPQSILVKFKPHASDNAKTAALGHVKGQTVKDLKRLGVRVIKVAQGMETSAVASLATDPAVSYAERDSIAVATDTDTNDSYWRSQKTQSYNRVHVPIGWDATTGSANAPLVAVLDTGVDATHPDLAGKVGSGWNFVANKVDTSDDNGHGTMVAGIIAANSNNATGIAGLCWGCSVMPVKVLDSSAQGSYSNIASGITYAVDHGAKIINLSLGGSTSSSTLQNAVNYAAGKGALVVAAAGNSTCNCVLYPAAYANVLSVGEVDSSNNNTGAYGSALDLVAPGSNWTTFHSPTNSTMLYAVFTGTSSATPVVAGLAALLMSLHGSWTAADVTSQIESTTTDLGTPGMDSLYGSGLVDFAAALGVSSTVTLPPPSATPSVSPGPTASATASPTQAPSPTPSPAATPTPSPTPSQVPSPTPTPAPSATPLPTASPTPTATTPPTTQTLTFSGALNKKNSSLIYPVAAGAGVADARLSFTKCRSLGVAVRAATGSTLSTSTGPSVLVLDTTLVAGSYSFVVSGSSQCAFTLTVTAPMP